MARAANFDAKSRETHKHATVILVHVLKEMWKQIKGCEVEGVQQLMAKATPIAITPFIQKHNQVSHNDLILLCYDMYVRQNSSMNLLFEASGQLVKVLVKRKGVVMPGKGPEKDEVMVCASGFGIIDDLDQWLVYQQAIGVKLVHLNVGKSFLANIDKSYVLRTMLGVGFVTMLVWHNELNSTQVFYHSQSLTFLN